MGPGRRPIGGELKRKPFGLEEKRGEGLARVLGTGLSLSRGLGLKSAGFIPRWVLVLWGVIYCMDFCDQCFVDMSAYE